MPASRQSVGALKCINTFGRKSFSDAELLRGFPEDYKYCENGKYPVAADDLDLSGSGPLLVKVGSVTVLIGGGKDGFLYQVDAQHLNKRDQPENDSNTPRVIRFGKLGCPDGTHHIMGGPVVWPGTDRNTIFIAREDDGVYALRLGGDGLSEPSGSRKEKTSFTVNGHPGAILSLSANGDVSATGILWAYQATGQTHVATFGSPRIRGAILRALNASDLSEELWNERRGMRFRRQFRSL
jgi:hypothetical protein